MTCMSTAWREVTPWLKGELEARRVGNICWVARENGWRMEICRREDSHGTPSLKFRFVSPEGKRTLGEWCADPQVALRRACDEVEKWI
jgi:hypothetical protein